MVLGMRRYVGWICVAGFMLLICVDSPPSHFWIYPRHTCIYIYIQHIYILPYCEQDMTACSLAAAYIVFWTNSISMCLPLALPSEGLLPLLFDTLGVEAIIC